MRYTTIGKSSPERAERLIFIYYVYIWNFYHFQCYGWFLKSSPYNYEIEQRGGAGSNCLITRTNACPHLVTWSCKNHYVYIIREKTRPNYWKTRLNYWKNRLNKLVKQQIVYRERLPQDNLFGRPCVQTWTIISPSNYKPFVHKYDYSIKRLPK